MSDDHSLQKKWDARYRDAVVAENCPARVLSENCHFLPSNGMALDLACGLGSNALWLSRRGFDVEAWDISTVAIAKLAEYADRHRLNVRASVRDALTQPPPEFGFDVIVVVSFLERSLCPSISAALRPGGVLFYQTFGPTGPGPSNSEFRLLTQELPTLFAGLDVLVYREENEVQLVARRPQ